LRETGRFTRCVLGRFMQEHKDRIQMLTQAASGCRKHALHLLETGDIQGSVRVMTDALTASAELAREKLLLFQAKTTPTPATPDFVAVS